MLEQFGEIAVLTELAHNVIMASAFENTVDAENVFVLELE